MNEPILKINNFSGINDKGMFWLDGFVPKFYGGQSVLEQANYANYFLSEDTTGFAGLNNPAAMADYIYNVVVATVVVDSVKRVALINSNASIYSIDPLGMDHEGIIHTFAQTGSGADALAAISGPDVIQSKSGNLLYTLANHVGVGFVGIAKAGSGATLIIDTDGRDMSTLGVTTSAGSNKIYNLSKKEEYTITSLSNESATKDGMNFDAGSTTPAAGDIFMVFVDNRFKFTTSSVVNNHFLGQDNSLIWQRPIISWNDAYYMLNGNYISKLAKDDATWTSDILDEEHKQLPDLAQGYNLSYNQDKMVVLANVRGRGMILLWNGFTPAWNNIINTEYPPSACVRYKDGWIITIGETLYYTNGYSLEYLTKLPDSESLTTQGIARKSIELFDEKIYVLRKNAYNTARVNSGLYIYDFKTGWTYSRLKNGTKSSNTPQMIFNSFTQQGNSSFQYMFLVGSDDTSTHTDFICKHYPMNSEISSAIFFIELPHKMNIGTIEIGITPKISEINSRIYNSTVVVNYGDGNYPLYRQSTFGAGSTTSLIKAQAGNNYPAKVGQLIEVQNGNIGGERTYITAIANQDTATEEWAISPALTATPTANQGDFSKLNLYLSESKTISNYNMTKDLIFNVNGIFTDKLVFEVYIKGTGQGLDITHINIY